MCEYVFYKEWQASNPIKLRQAKANVGDGDLIPTLKVNKMESRLYSPWFLT